MVLPIAAASATNVDQAELSAYVRARAADTLGASDKAVQGYGTALASSPDNQVVATRALSQALAAGDRPLAVRAAVALRRLGVTTSDVRCVLITKAVRTGDWQTANAEIDGLSKDQVFAFMAPILRAWVAVGSGKGDPLTLLGAGAGDPIAASYVSQHRPLLLLALGRENEGLIELRNRVEAQDSRAQTLQIAAAARLAREGKREEALRLLTGDGNAVTGARAWLEKQKSLPGEITTPAQGVSEFFLRLAIDLRRQDVVPLAISFARLSTFLAPERSESWLVTSALLAGKGEGREALAALGRIPATDPAAPLVEDVRIGLLAAVGDKRGALQQAEKATRGDKGSVADWTRLGDLYGQLERHLDAAEAYRRALDLKGQQPDGRAAWALWLLRGGALERADHWTDAKAALEEAHRLAPNEPLVLNYLGYAQLERRENLAEAEKLIRQASELQPDSAQITDSLGWANYLQGNVATAVELLERAVEGEPTDPAINEHLGDAYYAMGRRYEARYAWNAALVVADDKDAARLRAKIASGLTPELASP